MSLRNPLQYNPSAEILRGNNLGPNDFSELFMHCYEYTLSVKLGLAQNQTFSNNFVDLKNQYYADIDEQKY